MIEPTGKMEAVKGDNTTLNSSNCSFLRPSQLETSNRQYSPTREEIKKPPSHVEEVPSVFEESMRGAGSSITSSANTQIESLTATFNETVLNQAMTQTVRRATQN